MSDSERRPGFQREQDLDGDPIIVELRRFYEGVVDEPLPDNLVELLQKLDEVERGR